MNKRSFRGPQSETASSPGYPTLDQFDLGRRDFLSQLGALGAALLGAGALAACGDRPVSSAPDAGGPVQPPGGTNPMPPAPIDTRPKEPDWGLSGGGKALPDAGIDRAQRPDVGTLEGDVAGPDARIDAQDVDPSPGYANTMDARVDGIWTPQGEAPAMDAGGCRPKP